MHTEFNFSIQVFLPTGSDAVRYCPDCDTPLSYRDSRPRIRRTYGGEKTHVLVRRFYCHKCHRLHTELPSQLTPHKHYETCVIEDVLDGVVTEDSVETEEGPSEMTMKRWRSWYKKNVQRILGCIRSARHRSHGFTAETGSGESLLAHLRKEGQGWLGAVQGIVYNTGGFLAPDSS